MSIQSEIDRIKGNVASAYSAVGEKGGTLPEEQNSANLAAAVRGIPAGDAVTNLVNAPIGAIVAWSGTEEDVPGGWHICNGEDGTIDLRDKFVLGAGDKHPVGETGGEEEVTLTIEQMPKHSHSVGRFNSSGSLAGVVGGAGSSTTSVHTTSNGSSQPHPNMPPYYALLFIQKVSAGQEDYISATDDTLTKSEDGTLSVTEPTRFLTQAEYDALSDKEKDRGIFCITDAEPSGGSGGGSSGQGEVYSTEETRIGTWIDGKPLYRLTYSGVSAYNQNTATTFTFSGFPYFDVEEICSIRGTIRQTTGGTNELYPLSTKLEVYYDFNSVNWYMIAGANALGTPFTVTVEYTKTTDTPEVTA